MRIHRKLPAQHWQKFQLYYTPRLTENVQSFMIRLKNRGYVYECLRNVSPESFSAAEKVHFKTTNAHRGKFILSFVTQSHPALPLKPQEHTDGEMTP